MMRISNTSIGPAPDAEAARPAARGFVGTLTGLFKPSAALPDASLLQGQLQAAKSEIDKLQQMVGSDMFEGLGGPFGRGDLIRSASTAQAEANQEVANAQNALRDVQQQLADREREVEILEGEVSELNRFLDTLVSEPARADKVADMLDRELRAARKRVNKLTRDCQVLQDMLYAKSMELARSCEEAVELRELQARSQKQISALKILFSEKVRESASLMRGLELANGMLLAVKGELAQVQEARVGLEAEVEQRDRDNEALARRLQELEHRAADTSQGAGVSEEAMEALQAQLQAKSDTLKAALSELETANEHLERMSRNISIKDDTIAHLQRQVRALEVEVREGAALAEALRAEAAEARAAAEGAPGAPGSGTPAGKAAEKALRAKQQAEMQKLKEDVKEREARVREAQAIAMRAESQLSGLKTVLATKNTQCHKLENEARTLEGKLRDAQRELAQENNALRGNLSDAQEQIKVLRDRISLQQEVHAGVQQQLEATRSHMTGLLEGLGAEAETLQGGAPQLSLRSRRTTSTSQLPHGLTEGLQLARHSSLVLDVRRSRSSQAHELPLSLAAAAAGARPDTLVLAAMRPPGGSRRSTSQALELPRLLVGEMAGPAGATACAAPRAPSSLGPGRRATKDSSGSSIPAHIQLQLESAKKLLHRMGSGIDRQSSFRLAPDGEGGQAARGAGGEAAAALQLQRRGRHTIGDVASHSHASPLCAAGGGSSSAAKDGAAEGGARSTAGSGSVNGRTLGAEFDRSKRHTVATIPDLETVQEANSSSSSSDCNSIPRAEGEAEDLI